jgi:hypothetical protein
MITQEILVNCFAEAIATKEGFYLKKKIPSISTRLNNPGNLEHWKNKKGQSYPICNGYVNFPTEEEGFTALRKQIKINIGRDLTWKQFFAGKRKAYSVKNASGQTILVDYPGFTPRGRGENDPVRYALEVVQFIARKLPIPFELSIDDKITRLFEEPAVQGIAA